MKNISPLILSALILSCFPAFSQEQIIPMPASIEILDGKPIILNKNIYILVSFSEKEVLKQALFIQSEILKGTGLKLRLLDNDYCLESSNGCDILLSIDSSLKDKGKEAYSITANSHGIQLTAATPEGLYYAFCSLSQMLPVEFHDPKADKSKVIWKIATNPSKSSTIPALNGAHSCSMKPVTSSV